MCVARPVSFLLLLSPMVRPLKVLARSSHKCNYPDIKSKHACNCCLRSRWITRWLTHVRVVDCVAVFRLFHCVHSIVPWLTNIIIFVICEMMLHHPHHKVSKNQCPPISTRLDSLISLVTIKWQRVEVKAQIDASSDPWYSSYYGCWDLCRFLSHRGQTGRRLIFE